MGRGKAPANHGDVRVLRSEELPPGTLREVTVGSRRVLVARLRSGQLAAAGAACPHEQAPLADGTVRGEAVDCPRHHYLFDLRTGRNLYPYPIYPAWKREQVGELSLPIFRCHEGGGWISVNLES